MMYLLMAISALHFGECMKSVLACIGILMLTATTQAQFSSALPDGLYSEVKTGKGTIVGELYYKKVPLTVAHYVGLAEGTIGPRKGTPFFDGARIIRVDFVIQTGETRLRIPGFPDEMVPGLRHDALGIMQMSNSGPDTNGSYWCYMMEPTDRLNYLHTVFGKVVVGLDVLPKLKVDDTIQTLKILRIGADAEKFVVTEESYAALLAKAKKYDEAKLPREPGPEAFFDDAAKVLQSPPASRYNRARDFNFKLAKFHLFTGKTVKARVLAKMPEELSDGGKLKAYLDDLAKKLGLENEGALAVYFVDKDRWEVRVAKDSQASFIAGPRKADGTKTSVGAGKTLDDAVADFLTETRKSGEALIDKELKAATAMQPVVDGQKLKLKIDAVLDALIYRLE